MSMPVINNVQRGDLWMLVYDFAAIGDVLPMHNHDENTSHVILVMCGEVMLRVNDPANGTTTASRHKAGDIIDTHAGFPHEVTGLEAGSRTVHIPKKHQQPKQQVQS